MDFGNPFAIFNNRKKNKSSTILEKKQVNSCHRRRQIIVRAPKTRQILIKTPAPKQKEPTPEPPETSKKECTPSTVDSGKTNIDYNQNINANISASELSDSETDNEVPVIVNRDKESKLNRIHRAKIEKKSQKCSRVLQTSQYILNKIKRPAITMVSSLGSYFILQQYILPFVNVLNPQAFLTSALYSAIGSATESFMA